MTIMSPASTAQEPSSGLADKHRPTPRRVTASPNMRLRLARRVVAVIPDAGRAACALWGMRTTVYATIGRRRGNLASRDATVPGVRRIETETFR
jgi:hypothetical protein